MQLHSFAIAVFLSATLILTSGCDEALDAPPRHPTPIGEDRGDVVVSWMDLTLDRVQADGLTPPQTSRILAYSGVALYEALLGGMPRQQSFGGQLAGLGELPALEPGVDYDFYTVAHATMGHLMPLLFVSDESRRAFKDFAEEGMQQRAEAGVSADVRERSRAYGVLVAEVIDAWAYGDGYDDAMAVTYEFSDEPHAWRPTAEGMQALLPGWGRIRPFALPAANACAPPPPPAFETLPHSALYRQALAVWNASRTLTPDQEHIANFWADNVGASPTPPGHWMRIAAQVLADRHERLDRSAETVALLGLVQADAFISCWDEKYRSNLLRPVTYIRDHIDEDWTSLVSTPPFPEYTSGHSNASAAAARVLTEQLGAFPFADRTHQSQGLGVRHFDDFQHAAQEAAISRLYGGIHYPIGIDYGMPQGECVAGHLLEGVETRRMSE
ncbi:vanadium-dependent haloperoxidase [Lujinxingia vulgaris]|uniref:Vanadium-dependent haloperoxidase n=1 Tax=Lujinxingia vulgaris TaxID=2600176 RepID=A0A5C6XEI4_9DELT|nr:vanadium-dependent haloperoxidase [Lujinxingia vulgaris]TXD35808.1 vanadium-dependent haloperoxidase [Lujinxingia vulgaris]